MYCGKPDGSEDYLSDTLTKPVYLFVRKLFSNSKGKAKRLFVYWTLKQNEVVNKKVLVVKIKNKIILVASNN